MVLNTFLIFYTLSCRNSVEEYEVTGNNISSTYSYAVSSLNLTMRGTYEEIWKIKERCGLFVVATVEKYGLCQIEDFSL